MAPTTITVDRKEVVMTLAQETLSISSGLIGYSRLTDEELVESIKEGDKAAFDALVRRWLPKTYKKVRRLVGEEAAEDVTQDIFLNLVRSIGNFKGLSVFATWFSKLVVNKAADYHRRNFRERARFDRKAEAPERVTQATQGDGELETLLIELGLPKHYREVILMKLQYDLSFAEIAEVIGKTYEAARSRYRRGIRRAAAKLDTDSFQVMC